jgi:hypothetical protein
MQKILPLPIIACLFISAANFFLGQFFDGFLWIAVAFLLSLTLFPIIFNLDDKTVPILQIFSALFFLIIYFFLAAFLDFKEAGFLTEKAFLYGLSAGIGATAFLMLFRNK